MLPLNWIEIALLDLTSWTFTYHSQHLLRQMVKVALSRFVNSFKLICISQLGLTYCVTHFENKSLLVRFWWNQMQFVCLWDRQRTRCSLQLKHFASRGGFVFCVFGWRSRFLCARYCSLQSRVVKRIQGFWDLLCRIHFLGPSTLKQAQL